MLARIGRVVSAAIRLTGIARWCCALALVLSAGCAERSYRYTQLVMGVEATITVAGVDESTARHGAAAAFSRLGSLERAMSDYQSDSEIMRLVTVAHTDQWASADLIAVLERSEAMRLATDGAFDVTIGPLTELWRSARARGALPNQALLDAARARVGGDAIVIDATASTVRFTRPGVRVDFGGIGKGFAAERAIETLRGAGCPRSLVAIAGDIAAGDPPRGERGWRVTLDDGVTIPEVRRAAASIHLRNASVSTSGDREQWIEIDGVRRSHVLDPATGLGATTGVQATVVGPDGAIVDALASVLSLRALDEAEALMERFPGYAARILGPDRHGTIREVITAAWPDAAIAPHE